MSCIIIYKDNKPVGVQDSEGNSSKLFQEILSNPHVADFNAALEIYQNIYSSKIRTDVEPILAKEQKFYLEVNKELESLINPVLTELNSLGKEPIIVGGAVRDAFLGKSPKDFDIEVYNTSLEDLEITLKKYGKVDAVGKDFGILKFTPYATGTTNLVKIDEPFDFSIPRREAKVGIGHKGFKTEFDLGMTKSEAASRRDFTWNTIGYNPITHTLYDYYGGITDLKAGVIRHTTDKFREDPLRIMRAMQFQARLGYEVAPETYTLMGEMVESGEFDSLPTERITEEWIKWASKGIDHTGIFDFLRNSGLGERYYPELMALKDTVQDATWHPEGDVEAHTKQVLAKADEIAEREKLSDKDKQILIFSSLLHDISKPETTETIYSEKLGRDTITARGHEAAGEAKAISILSKIGIPVALRDQVGSLIREHLAHATISSIESEKGKQSAFAKLVNRTQPASVEQLMLLMEADMLGRNNANASTPITIQEFDRLLTEYKDNNKGKLAFTPILSGKHLIERGFKPGVELGAVLAKAKEAQLNLDFTNESEALEWLSSYLTENPSATQAEIKRQVSEVATPNTEVVAPILNRLLETDLADNVYYVSGEEINVALERLGAGESKSVEGVSFITAGFIHGKNVYINKDQATGETAIHEFNHLYTTWLKSNRTEVYNKGIELVKENTDGALDEIIQSVKDTQPDLVEGSEAFYEEVLTEAVGKKGAKIIAEKPDSPIAEWLQEVWDALKNMLGLSQYSTKEIMEMNLNDFITASATDLLKGKPIEELFSNRILGNNKIKIEVNYLEEAKKDQLIKDGLLEEKDSLDFMAGKQIITSSPDDMLVGTVSVLDVKGNNITSSRSSEGSGGLHFVTKFGEVWAFRSVKDAKKYVTLINSALKANGGEKTWFVLTKGSDAKLLSNPQGVTNSLNITTALMDAGFISVSDMRSAVTDAVKQFKDTIDIGLKESTTEIKKKLNDFFQDKKKVTFEIRGNVLRQIITNLNATASFKKNRKEIAEFLGADSSNFTTKAAVQDAIALVSAERFTLGLKGGDVYAAIEINHPVEVKETDHATFNGGLIMRDSQGNEVPPKLVLISGSHSAYSNLTTIEGKSVNDYESRAEGEKSFRGAVTGGGNTGFGKAIVQPNIASKKASEKPVIKFQKKEPTLLYKNTRGEVFNSSQEAIKNSVETSIAMGIDTVDGFKELATISTTANINTKEGIINSLTKANLLSGETFIDTNGKKVYKIKGNEKAKKIINSELAITSIRERLGTKSVKALSNGDIVFDDNHTKRQIAITKKDGSTQYITPEDLSNMTFSQLRKENEDAVAIIALREFKSSTSIYGEKVEEEVPFMPENELQLKLMTLLKSMGVKTTSIADYVANYTVKNGVEPSAQALADLANNVIAFKDGVVQAEDLLEETAHFIIAQTPESEKADLKRNIHKSLEWVEFQASYREIYSKDYSGEELEDIVREEILGKVLKNAVASRFQAETEAQQNIYNKVLEFFKNFFTKVEAYFTNDSQLQLNKFTSAVYENLMNDSLNGMLTGENNRNYTLYSTTNNNNSSLSQQYKQASELLERLTQQQYELSKKYNSAGNTNQLRAAKTQMENLDNQVDEVARMKALLNLARVANSQINTLANVVETNLKKGYHFSQEENSVYQSFITKLEPLLAQVNSQITGNTTQEKQVKSEIESVLRKSITLKGKTPLINEKALDMMVDRVIKKNSLTGAEADKYREEIRAIMNAAQKDTQFLHAHLGSLSNAKNGFLNLAGDVIERVQYTERSLYLPRIKSFLTNMNTIGFDTKNLKKFIKDGFIINEVDAVKEKKADAEDRADSFNAAGLGIATVEDIDSKLEEVDTEIRTLEVSKSDKARLTNLIRARQDYFRKYKMKKSKRRETYFTPEYLAKMENAFVLIDGDKISKRDLPESAREVDKFYRSQITQIRLNAENGILTASDAEDIRELNRQRQQDTFPRDTEGNLKKGLTETYNTELGKYVIGRDMTVQLSDSEASERDIVYGLQMMGLINQEFYKNQPSLNGIPSKFLEELNKLGSEKEKWDFIQLNSYIGFEDSFWESFKPEDSLVNRLRAQGQTDMIDEIRTQQQIITNILKQNRKFNSPTETDMSVSTGMSQIEIDSVKNASSVLENILSRARGLLKDETEPNLEIESRTNEAYKESLEDLGINTLVEEIKFISNNTTTSNAGYIDSARKIADALKNGEDVKLNKTFSKVFNSTMTADEIDVALLTYAKSKLLPYFKRTEPVGYSEKLASFRESIDNNVEGTVESLLLGTSNLNSDIKVSPSFSFFESTEGVNPKWIANRDSKRDQYSKEWLDRVRNEEYYTTFGVDRETGVRTGNLNQKDWEAREELLKLQDWTLENYRLSGTHNRYLLPQQRKNAVERGIKGLKNDVKDFVSYREDERELGQEIGGVAAKKGSTLLTIPTYGVQKLEDQEDVSTQLLESYAWMAQQSSLYRARKENISDMLVLNDLILSASYGAKEAEATATYTMFKSFLQANFYGVKESLSYETTVAGKRIDLGKMAKSFNNWVRFSNLAGITVPITSAITGKIAEFVEKVVGEAINPMAYKKAHTEFVKHSSEAAREIGGFTSNSKLNVVLEAIGVYNVNERFQNSNYGKSTRVGLKASSGLHAMGNFPVTATTGLSVIYDYKYYGDDIITFDQFKRKNPTKDAAAVKEEWSKLEEFYSDWIVKDGVLTFDKASIAKKINVANLEELLNLKMEAISTRTTSVIQRVDAQVPEHQRSVASRNAFANFFMMHLNWFLIQSQLKLKDRHYNISEDTYQEGNWRTAWNFLQSGIMKPKNIKQLWKESMADELTRKNLKRTVVELSVANALAVAAMLLANYVDDEEDPSWFLAWSDYMMTRAAVEQISGTVALPKQVGELLTNPLIASQKFYDLFSILDVFSSEETQRGVYAGETARMKWARRNLPWIRDYTRLKDPKSAADTYTYFAVEKPNLYDDWAWLSNAFDSDVEE